MGEATRTVFVVWYSDPEESDHPMIHSIWTKESAARATQREIGDGCFLQECKLDTPRRPKGYRRVDRATFDRIVGENRGQTHGLSTICFPEAFVYHDPEGNWIGTRHVAVPDYDPPIPESCRVSARFAAAGPAGS